MLAGGVLRTIRPQVLFSKSGGTPASYTSATMANNFSRPAQVMPVEGFDQELVTEMFEVPAGWSGGPSSGQISISIGLVQNEAVNATIEVDFVGLIEVTQ